MTFSLGLFSYYPIAAGVLILLLLIGLAISSYFVSQRLKHKKTRRVSVLIANTVAALAVVGLAFDIQITNKQVSVTYLVTNGATIEQLSQIDKQQPIFIMQGAMGVMEAMESISDNNIVDIATAIHIPSQVLSHQPDISNLHVLGDGLSAEQWRDMQLLIGDTFKNISITFSTFKPRIGLINMQWPRELAVGQFIQIKGQLQGSDGPDTVDNIYQVTLVDPIGQIVETIRLKASESFTLSFPATSIGQWVYRLQLSKSGENNPIADEPIAFVVAKPATLRILIKQSAPSFETRQLKNWAAEFGSQISVLTQISQTKDIRQNINMDTETLEQITLTANEPFTEQALVNFDWLLIDGRALLTLTAQQTTALQTAIKNGLGMYIITDNELINAWPVPSLDWLLDINLQPLDVANYSAIPYWPHSKIEQAMPLVKANITSARGAYLVQNKEAQILVSHSKIGLGHVAVSLINTTYGWQTSGLTEQYSHYWQSVIYELARPKQSAYWQSTQPNSLTLVNKHMQKCLLGATELGVTTYDQHPYPLILTQDLIQTEQQCLTMWPTNAGWHKLIWSENTTVTDTNNAPTSSVNTWFYAHAEQDWQQWRQVKNQLVSQKIAQQQITKKGEKPSVKSLDKDWVWALLVLSMSLLWLERKLFKP
ncbi:MAG: hypothetical protein ACI8Y3_000872 [Paraglaciecola sp.]|jgi:hypothetical protein